MKPVIKNLEITRGDTTAIGITVRGLDGAPMELYFSVKKNYNDKNYIIQKTLEDGITDDGENRYVVRIESEDTETMTFGKYVYDFEITVNNSRKTLLKGDFIVDPDVTRHLGV